MTSHDMTIMTYIHNKMAVQSTLCHKSCNVTVTIYRVSVNVMSECGNDAHRDGSTYESTNVNL